MKTDINSLNKDFLQKKTIKLDINPFTLKDEWNLDQVIDFFEKLPISNESCKIIQGTCMLADYRNKIISTAVDDIILKNKSHFDDLNNNQFTGIFDIKKLKSALQTLPQDQISKYVKNLKMFLEI